MNKWKEVWNGRTIESELPDLDALVQADGFDQGAGRIAPDAWKEYVAWISDEIGIRKGDSVFEVGCGSGAFLLPLFLSGHTVGGIDYSGSLITVARRVMPGMDFSVGDAAGICGRAYDHVVANSVFHYFPDKQYAENVVRGMMNKAALTVSVLEVPDAAGRDAAERVRAGSLPPGEYEKKYRGYEHLYYEQEWFGRVADDLHCRVRILKQRIRQYGNNDFRFNVIMEKSVA